MCSLNRKHRAEGHHVEAVECARGECHVHEGKRVDGDSKKKCQYLKMSQYALLFRVLQLTRSCSNTSVTQLDNMPGWHDDQLTMDSDHTLNSIPDGSIYLFK